MRRSQNGTAEEGAEKNNELLPRNSVILYRNMYECTLGLRGRDRLRLLDAVTRWGLYGEDAHLRDSRLDSLYRYMKDIMQSTIDRYDERERRKQRDTVALQDRTAAKESYTGDCFKFGTSTDPGWGTTA